MFPNTQVFDFGYTGRGGTSAVPLIIMNEKIRDIIQDCNINFLIGSGLSSPYLRTLGDIEALLTQLEGQDLSNDRTKLIRASLYNSYFAGAIAKNVKILDADEASENVLKSYCGFLTLINSILLRRKSTILSKEVNLFTTNIDVFLDKALEEMNLEYNDGFNGRFRPLFGLSNFKKSRFKKSLHYDNTSELPVFNLLKLHGSLTWQITGDDSIVFSTDLSHVREIQDKEVPVESLLEIADGATIDGLMALSEGKAVDDSLSAFMAAYEKLLIVNPTKEKFKHTLLNQTYYELLRLYSNELEKENTVLFVMGFSFADEHIREITLRAANSNPTLMVYVIGHSSKAKGEIEVRFGTNKIKNSNIEVIGPSQKEKDGEDDFKYDLSTINKQIFGRLFKVDDQGEN